MPDNWQALREALDAGPDEGPWVSAGPSYGAALPVYCNEVVIDREGDDEDTYQVCRAPLGLDAESTANMNYIGEASPKVIRALLDERDRLAKEVERLRADANKSERRAIAFGDIVAQHVMAMRAAVVAGHLESPANGLQWIVNTLVGPGHLPDIDEAHAVGGAQAMFDKEMAEHEAFRAAHPAPSIDAAMAADKATEVKL